MQRGYFIEDNLYSDSRLEILTENYNGSKCLYLEGPCVMADLTNRNGREYPMDTVARPMVDAYNRDFIGEGRAIGECEHPEYPFPKMKEAAVMINDPLHWEGKNAIGKLRVLRNANGQVIESLAEAGYRLGVSTRGLGTATFDAHREVDVIDRGFMLTAVDAVDKPSGQTCYVKPIRESIEWVQESSGDWRPVDVNEKHAKRFMKAASMAEAEEFAKRFKAVLKHLS